MVEFIGRSISVGGSGEDVDLKANGHAFDVHGKWLFPKNTIITAQKKGIGVNGQPLEPGSSTVLDEGALVNMGVRSFDYTKK